MAIDPAWIALIGTLCGGIGLKIAEHWLGKNKVRTDDATQIRDELRLRIESQDNEIRELEAERDKFRDQYYVLYEKYLQQQRTHDAKIAELRDEAFNNVERQTATGQTSQSTPILDATDPDNNSAV